MTLASLCLCPQNTQFSILRPGNLGERVYVTKSELRDLTPTITMKVLSWNLLADGLAQTGGFSNVEAKSLDWVVRGPTIVQLIKHHNPDVICLAECNRFDYLLQQFPDYLGVFS